MPRARLRPRTKTQFYVIDPQNETVIASGKTEAEVIKDCNTMAEADDHDLWSDPLCLVKTICDLRIEVIPRIVKDCK